MSDLPPRVKRLLATMAVLGALVCLTIVVFGLWDGAMPHAPDMRGQAGVHVSEQPVRYGLMMLVALASGGYLLYTGRRLWRAAAEDQDDGAFEPLNPVVVEAAARSARRATAAPAQPAPAAATPPPEAAPSPSPEPEPTVSGATLSDAQWMARMRQAMESGSGTGPRTRTARPAPGPEPLPDAEDTADDDPQSSQGRVVLDVLGAVLLTAGIVVGSFGFMLMREERGGLGALLWIAVGLGAMATFYGGVAALWSSPRAWLRYPARILAGLLFLMLLVVVARN